MEKKAVLLLSGGPDSATLMKWAKKNEYDDIQAVYLRCGHSTDEKEMECADKIASEVNAPLEIMDISQMVSALGGQRILIHSNSSIMPFGNAIVLSMAITYALKIKANSILIALHADDSDESDEYKREFIDAIQNLAQRVHGDIKIETPFIKKRKSEVFNLGKELGVAYENTWSCIRPGKLHCGYCNACRSRSKAFNLVQIPDPTKYERPVVAPESVISQ